MLVTDLLVAKHEHERARIVLTIIVHHKYACIHTHAQH